MSHRNLVGLLLGIAVVGLISGSLYAKPAGHPVVPVVDATKSETAASRGLTGGVVEHPALNLTEMFFPGLAAMTANPLATPIRGHLGGPACNSTCSSWREQCVSQGGGSACRDAFFECIVCCFEVGQASWPVGVPPYPFG